MADKIGERVAEGDMVEISLEGHIQETSVRKCTCIRYSERRDEYVHFWYESDPKCEYTHPVPLPQPHKIKLAP